MTIPAAATPAVHRRARRRDRHERQRDRRSGQRDAARARVAQLGQQERDEERREDRVEAELLRAPSALPANAPIAVPPSHVTYCTAVAPNRKWRSKLPPSRSAIAHDVDSSAPYEAHIRKSDGTEVEVQVGSDFTVTAVNTMQHP